jgi:DNA polymerase-3 subunit gamma/tau
MPEDLAAVAEMFGAHREGILQATLRNNLRLVSFQAGLIEATAEGNIPKDFAPSVARFLRDWTGQAWEVRLVPGGTEPTLAEREAASNNKAHEQVGRDPLVQRALEVFPGAKITEVRDLTAGAPDPAPLAEDNFDENFEGSDAPMSRKAGE